MNELPVTNNTTSSFDYAVVDSETASFLQQKETNIEGIYHKARFDVGRELKETQELLSKCGYGCFGQWCESIGFNREMSSRLIQYHELIVRNSDKRELIESLPKTLAQEIARPSAPEDLKQAVLNGDITTHKEYQQLLKAQKEAEQRAQEAEQRADNLFKSLEQARTKAATVNNIEAANETLRTANQLLENKIKTVGDPIIVEQPVQVFPPDYERVKRENAELKAKQQNISLQQLAQVDENCRQYAKTIAEEEKAAKLVDKILSVLLDLPADNEIEEMARCYLKFSPADMHDEIIVTCNEIETGITRLQKLNVALKGSTKMRVVK